MIAERLDYDPPLWRIYAFTIRIEAYKVKG
jgi:hypothetical protein